jgi:hypothetical protein
VPKPSPTKRSRQNGEDLPPEHRACTLLWIRTEDTVTKDLYHKTLIYSNHRALSQRTLLQLPRLTACVTYVPLCKMLSSAKLAADGTSTYVIANKQPRLDTKRSLIYNNGHHTHNQKLPPCLFYLLFLTAHLSLQPFFFLTAHLGTCPFLNENATS